MKKLTVFSALASLFLAVLVSFSTVQNVQADDLRVLSFNIRLSYGEIGKPTEWKNRKEHVAEIIQKGKYDFVGIQEAIITAKPGLNQVEDLKALLPEYELLTRSRTTSETEGESTPIMWRKDRWEIDAKEHGVFWLSDTPNVPASITWENACPRTVVWGKFYELKDGKRTGKCLYFINTHFDHVSEKARQLASVMIVDLIRKHASGDVPAFVTGDLNCGESSEGIKYLSGKPAVIQGEEMQCELPIADTFRLANPEEKNVQTFHGFNDSKFAAKIDYVFMKGNLKVKSAKIIREKKDIYPSDHFPVDAVMEW